MLRNCPILIHTWQGSDRNLEILAAHTCIMLNSQTAAKYVECGIFIYVSRQEDKDEVSYFKSIIQFVMICCDRGTLDVVLFNETYLWWIWLQAFYTPIFGA